MTKKSHGRRERDRRNFPRRDNVASAQIDNENKKIIFTTNDMLVNQIHRDSPRVAKSFDFRTGSLIAECSPVYGLIAGHLVRHLPRLDDKGFKATASRLLLSASNSYVASIQLARSGFPRQYGAVARMMIEAMAMVIVLAIREGAVESFHAGKLDANKCVGWSKAALPPLGQYWGMLSNDFVHIGPAHAAFEVPTPYKDGDEALSFLANSIRGNIWLLYIVTDLIFSDETPTHRFWRREGEKAWFDPAPETWKWTKSFFGELFDPEAASPP
jgi:hypothetical protein